MPPEQDIETAAARLAVERLCALGDVATSHKRFCTLDQLPLYESSSLEHRDQLSGLSFREGAKQLRRQGLMQ